MKRTVLTNLCSDVLICKKTAKPHSNNSILIDGLTYESARLHIRAGGKENKYKDEENRPN